MKQILFLIAFSCTVAVLSAQNYADGVNDLLEMKFASRDIANAIKWEWNHETPEYREAIRKYNAIGNSVDAMIGAFEAKIRSGKKVTDKDIESYVRRIDGKFQAFYNYYESNSAAGSVNALFGLSDLFSSLNEIYRFVGKTVNQVKADQTEARLRKMHGALGQCRLPRWEDV